MIGAARNGVMTEETKAIFSIPAASAPVTAQRAAALSPTTLAFVGDGVQSLYVRARLALCHEAKSGALHKLSVRSVSAAAQARSVERLLSEFTEDELSVYKRARNAKTGSVSKNAQVVDYRKATGLEAVLGYLYLSGQTERLALFLEETAKDMAL